MYEHYIFSPCRMSWIKSSQGKNKKNAGCVFCKIAKGDSRIPQKVLYKSRGLMVLMNVFPYNTGHLQVMPARHAERLEDLSDGEISSLFIMVKKCVRLLKKIVKPDGFNIGINLGGDAGGASVSHLHIHIVPRFHRDLGFMESIADTKVLPSTLNQTYKELKKAVKMLE